MFSSIDSFVTKANSIDPAIAKDLDRNVIVRAMKSTRELDALLSRAKEISDAKRIDKNQETLFNEQT
tara:strand:- start:4957 stop:5157 length:201 start_codon:yes stop_codon:yes gene_type:complete